MCCCFRRCGRKRSPLGRYLRRPSLRRLSESVAIDSLCRLADCCYRALRLPLAPSCSPLRGIAANGADVFARCREATSRFVLPLGGAAAGGARRGGSARTADPAVTGQDVPSRRPRARRQPPGLRTAKGGPERHLGVSSLWFLSLDKQRKEPAPFASAHSRARCSRARNGCSAVRSAIRALRRADATSRSRSPRSRSLVPQRPALQTAPDRIRRPRVPPARARRRAFRNRHQWRRC